SREFYCGCAHMYDLRTRLIPLRKYPESEDRVKDHQEEHWELPENYLRSSREHLECDAMRHIGRYDVPHQYCGELGVPDIFCIYQKRVHLIVRRAEKVPAFAEWVRCHLIHGLDAGNQK